MDYARAPFVGANDNYCADHFLHETPAERHDVATRRYFDKPANDNNPPSRSVKRAVLSADNDACYCSSTVRSAFVSVPRVSILDREAA